MSKVKTLQTAAICAAQLVTVLIAVLVTGCRSSVPTLPMKSEPSPGKALITFARGGGRQYRRVFAVFKEDKVIGIVPHGHYMQLEVDPGENRFLVRADNWVLVKANVEAGGHYVLVMKSIPAPGYRIYAQVYSVVARGSSTGSIRRLFTRQKSVRPDPMIVEKNPRIGNRAKEATGVLQNLLAGQKALHSAVVSVGPNEKANGILATADSGTQAKPAGAVGDVR